MKSKNDKMCFVLYV